MSERDERMRDYVDLEGMKTELDSAVEDLLTTTEQAMKASSKREIRRYQKIREEQQKTVEELMEDFEQVFEVTSDGLTDLDRDMYDTFLGGRKKDLHTYDVIYKKQMKKQTKQMKSFFGVALDGWEDLEDKSDSFLDLVNAININSIKDSIDGVTSDAVDHIRNIQQGLNLSNKEMDALKGEIKDMAGELSDEFGAMISSADLTEAIGYAVSDLGIRDQDFAAEIGKQLSIFKKGTNLDYEAIDSLVKSIDHFDWDPDVLYDTANTMKKLSSSYAVSEEAMAGAIEQLMGRNTRIANGDADKYREIENNLLKATAMFEDNYVDSSKIMEKFNMDQLEFIQDEGIQLLSAGGANIQEMSKLLQEGAYDDVAKMYMDAIKNIDASGNTVLIDKVRGSLDLTTDEWERMVTAMNNGYADGLSKEMDNVIKSTENGIDKAINEATHKSLLDKVKDGFGLSDIGFGLTNFIEGLDVDLTDILIAVEGFKTIKNSKIGKGIGKIFSKGIGKIKTSFGGFGKTAAYSADDIAKAFGTSIDDVYATFGKTAKYSADDIAKAMGSSADDVAKMMGSVGDDVAKASGNIFTKGFSKIKSAFGKFGKTAAGATDDMAKVVASGADDVAKGGSKLFGKVFSNFGDDALKGAGKALGKVGKVAGKVAPWLSVAEAVMDMDAGAAKSKEWFGENATNQQGFSSSIATGLAGTGPAIDDKNATVGEKAMAIGSGALKGAGIGSFFGPIGTAVGAAVGAGLAAIGGERIAKFVDGVTSSVVELGNAVTGGVVGVLDELGPVGQLAGDLVQNQWDNVLQTKDAIEAVWADPDKGIIAKIGGTLAEGAKGVFNSVKGIFTTVKDWGKNMWEGIKEKAGAVWDKTKEFAKKAWGKAKDFAKKAWDTAKKVASEVWNGVKEVAGAVWEETKEVAGAVWGEVKDVASGIWGEVKDTAKGIWNEVKDTASAVWDGFLEGVNTFAEAGATLLEAGGSLLEGAGKLASGIGEGIGNALSGAGSGAGSLVDSLTGGKGVIGSITGGFKDLMSGASDLLFGGGGAEVDLSSLELTGDPLYDRLDIMTAYLSAIAANSGGEGGGGGLLGGLLELPGKLWEGGKELVSNLWEGGKNLATNLWEGGKDLATKAWEGTKDLASKAWEGTKDFASKAWEGTKKAASKVKEKASEAWEGAKDIASKAWSGIKGLFGSHKDGLGYVPYDGYLAQLHEGERVLTKEENQQYGEFVSPENRKADIKTAIADAVSKATKSVGAWISDKLTEVGAGGLVEKAKSIGSWISEKTSSVKDWFSEKFKSKEEGSVGSKIMDKLKSAGSWLADKITAAGGGGFVEKIKAAGGWISDKYNSVKGWFADKFGSKKEEEKSGSKLMEMAKSAGGWISEKFSSIKNMAGEFFKSSKENGLLPTLKEYFEKLKQPKVDGSHRAGLSYVPYDGYVAELHKGERVLTEAENQDYSVPTISDKDDQVETLTDSLSTAILNNTDTFKEMIETFTEDLVKGIVRSTKKKNSLFGSVASSLGFGGSSGSSGGGGGILSTIGNWFSGLFGGGSGGGGNPGGSDGGGSPAPAATGSGAESDIWNFFARKGLTAAGVAGLMGNLYAESGLRSNNLQNTYEKSLGYSDSSYTSAVDGGRYNNFVKDSAGYGLAQWTYHTRKKGLLDYAKSKSKSIGDMNMQLEFLWKELSGSYSSVLNTLKTTNDVQVASDKVLYDFERPANPNSSQRAGFAQSYMNKYASYDVGTPWVPNDQLAMIHEGEMIVPKKYNPLNKSTQTAGEDMKVNQYQSLDSLIDVIRQGFSYIGRKIDNIKVEVTAAAQEATREAYSPQFFKAGGTV